MIFALKAGLVNSGTRNPNVFQKTRSNVRLNGRLKLPYAIKQLKNNDFRNHEVTHKVYEQTTVVRLFESRDPIV